MTRHVVILGLMGSGKTSVGKRVARRLGVALVDGDELLEERTGRTAAEFADESGIDALHELEAELALEVLAGDDRSVIGPASSVCESLPARDALGDHDVIWLTAPAELLAEKAVRKSHRPLVREGDPVELFRRQIEVREPLVMALGPVAVVDVSQVDDDEAADQIVAALGGPLPTEPDRR